MRSNATQHATCKSSNKIDPNKIGSKCKFQLKLKLKFVSFWDFRSKALV